MMHVSKIWGVTVCTASILTVVAGCGSPSAAPDHVKPPTTHLNQSQETMELFKSLVPVHYTSSQINEISRIATSQHVQTPYVITRSGGSTGVYNLASVRGKGDVFELTYQNYVTLLESRSLNSIYSYMGAFEKGNKIITQLPMIRLINGGGATWRQIYYKTGSIVPMLVLKEGNTFVAMAWISGMAVDKPLLQAIASGLEPLSIIQTSDSYMTWATLIQQVMDSLQGSINVPLMAPSIIPSPGGYPSAQYQVGVIPSGVNKGVNYNVNLFTTKTPAFINDPSLKDQLHFGSFGGSRFGSVAKALNGMDFLNHDEGIIPQPSDHVSSVNLGYHVYGKLFKQGGATSIQWHEGRWLFEVNKNQGSADLNLAKQIVQFTQTNFLPVPDQEGLVIVNITYLGKAQNASTQMQSQAWWNKGAVLYNDQTAAPLNAMRMAVSTRLYSAKPATATNLGIEGTVQSVEVFANKTLLRVKVSAVPKVFSYDGHDFAQIGSVISIVFGGTPKNYFIGGGTAKKYLPVTVGQRMATVITSGKLEYGTTWHSIFDSYEYLQNGVYENWKEQTFGAIPYS